MARGSGDGMAPHNVWPTVLVLPVSASKSAKGSGLNGARVAEVSAPVGDLPSWLRVLATGPEAP